MTSCWRPPKPRAHTPMTDTHDNTPEKEDRDSESQGLACVLVVYQFGLARGREREACFRAFLHNNWVGMVIFAGIAADFALRTKAAAA